MKPKINTIPLTMKEPNGYEDIPYFIISHTYHFLYYFINQKIFEIPSMKFSEYLISFKKCFKKEILNEKISFDLLNKNNTKNFYRIKYKEFINIMNNQNPNVLERNIISNYISVRNSIIFLEYLYFLLKEYPKYISHYIIKIDISILLSIPKESAKRLIDSPEFFYLSLLELKSVFNNINYIPTFHVNYIDNCFIRKYDNIISELKKKKLSVLENSLYELYNSLCSNDSLSEKEVLIVDYLERKYKELSKDFCQINNNSDELIEKYIFKISNYEKKNLKQISKEDIEKKNINYLYLIALDSFNVLNENKQIKIDENKYEKNNEINSNNNIGLEQQLETLKLDILNENLDTKNEICKNKENIVEEEGLRIKVKDFQDEENITKLKKEEVEIEIDKYQDFLNRSYLYNKVFNLDKNNIYEILCFFVIYNEQKFQIKNYDELYMNYKNQFIEKLKNKYILDNNYFWDIIEDKSFYNDIIEILKSNPVKKYITSIRNYEEITEKHKDSINVLQFKFSGEGDIYVANYSDEYNELMKLLKNFNFFKNLFRLKFLSKGIRSYTDSNLKIILNSLYYKFNENIKNESKIIILKAVLKILFVHEILHVLKFMKKNANFDNKPTTPRKKESGENLINYLFGTPSIRRIYINEALKIDDINNWKEIDNLKNIFNHEELTMEEKDNALDKKDKIDDHIDLYLTGENLNIEEIKNNNFDDNDGDIDIN